MNSPRAVPRWEKVCKNAGLIELFNLFNPVPVSFFQTGRSAPSQPVKKICDPFYTTIDTGLSTRQKVHYPALL
jgi:hypothetical protein